MLTQLFQAEKRLRRTRLGRFCEPLESRADYEIVQISGVNNRKVRLKESDILDAELSGSIYERRFPKGRSDVSKQRIAKLRS
jgi:hypothetical protein